MIVLFSGVAIDRLVSVIIGVGVDVLAVVNGIEDGSCVDALAGVNAKLLASTITDLDFKIVEVLLLTNSLCLC